MSRERERERASERERERADPSTLLLRSEHSTVRTPKSHGWTAPPLRTPPRTLYCATGLSARQCVCARERGVPPRPSSPPQLPAPARPPFARANGLSARATPERPATGCAARTGRARAVAAMSRERAASFAALFRAAAPGSGTAWGGDRAPLPERARPSRSTRPVYAGGNDPRPPFPPLEGSDGSESASDGSVSLSESASDGSGSPIRVSLRWLRVTYPSQPSMAPGRQRLGDLVAIYW